MDQAVLAIPSLTSASGVGPLASTNERPKQCLPVDLVGDQLSELSPKLGGDAAPPIALVTLLDSLLDDLLDLTADQLSVRLGDLVPAIMVVQGAVAATGALLVSLAVTVTATAVIVGVVFTATAGVTVVAVAALSVTMDWTWLGFRPDLPQLLEIVVGAHVRLQLLDQVGHRTLGRLAVLADRSLTREESHAGKLLPRNVPR